MEQGKYAEAIASTGAEPEAVDPKTPAVTLVEKPAATPAPAAAKAGAASRAALVLADLDGDGVLDAGRGRTAALRVLHETGERFEDVTAKAGLAGVAAVRGAWPGTTTTTACPTCSSSRPAGLALFHNEGEGRFKDASAAARLPAWPYLAATAALVDIDHDGDLDVFVAGLTDGSGKAPAPSVLLQNNGDGTFTDVTASARSSAAPDARSRSCPTDFDNRRDVDLFVLREDAPALFKNMRDGSFRDVATERRALRGEGAVPLRRGRRREQGRLHRLLPRAAGTASWLALSDGRGAFAVAPAPAGTAGALAAQFVDYDDDGLLDLLVATREGRAPASAISAELAGPT